MALILFGLTRCPLCDEVIHYADAIVATSHFIGDPFHTLWRFSDATMHKQCFLQWGKRQEFVRLFNQTMASIVFGSGKRHQMQEDGEIVAVEPSVPSVTDKRDRSRMAIHDAAETGSVDDIARLLRDDPLLVNAPDVAGITPLHLAVAYQGAEEVETLLQMGANIHARTDTGQTILHTACIQGQGAVVRLLLAAGSDVRARDRAGETPLHLAAATSGADVITVLLVAGADIEGRDSEFQTPLHKAASHRRGEAIALLLDAGADINAHDGVGQTCLQKVAAGGNAFLLRLLLSRGADPAAKDAGGRTARQIAEAQGNTMAMRLIDHGDKGESQ